MSFLTRRSIGAALGLALLIASLFGASVYVSTHKINVNITSRIAAIVTVFVFLVIFVVLPLYSIIVTQEIAKRRRAEARFRGVLEAAPDAMAVMDREGRIVLVNAQVEMMFGYQRERLLGQEMEVLLPKLFGGRHAEHQSVSLNQPREWPMGTRLELDAQRKDGTEFPVEVSLSPLETKQGPLVCGAVRDVTDRKLAEEEIRRLNAGLENRNAELAAMVRELEAFTYSVAHDLRAPLRHIDGFSRILQEDLGPSLEAAATRNLQSIRDATQNMGHLVDDLLRLSRVGRQGLKLETVRLKTLIEDVITGFATEINDRQPEWRVGPLPLVKCDPGLMKQVFTNLLSNALKYTRPCEHPVIEAGQMSVDDEVILFVRDNGVGFNMKYADKLFGVFQRLHLAEDFEGTGVGLAIVQRIIQKHGGRIWAEAALNKGATFYFTIGPPRGACAESMTIPGEESCQTE